METSNLESLSIYIKRLAVGLCTCSHPLLGEGCPMTEQGLGCEYSRTLIDTQNITRIISLLPPAPPQSF